MLHPPALVLLMKIVRVMARNRGYKDIDEINIVC
jgi:hypothetical protein